MNQRLAQDASVLCKRGSWQRDALSTPHLKIEKAMPSFRKVMLHTDFHRISPVPSYMVSHKKVMLEYLVLKQIKSPHTSPFIMAK